MKNLLLNILLIFAISNTFAQHGSRGGYGKSSMPQVGVISGKIFDDANKPVEFASVSLMLLRDSSIAAGSFSDAKGEFKFKKLKMGAYSLKIKLLGFKAKIIKPIYLFPEDKGGKGKGLVQSFNNIILSNSDVEIDDVDVVADKSHVQYKLDKKIVNVSQDISSGGGSAVDVLENTPSVTVDIDGNVELRGSTSFTVLIDGKPTVLDASDALQQIPAGAIENIEIITNPSAKFDPDGAAGIINIVMKKKKEIGLNGLIQVSAGTHENYKGNASFSYRVGKLNLTAGFDYSNQNYPGSGKLERVIRNDNEEFFSSFYGDRSRTRKGYRVKGGFDYYINDKNTLSVSGSYGARDFKHRSSSLYHDYQLNNYDLYYIRKGKNGRSGASYDVNASYTLYLKAKQKLETSLRYSNRDGDGQEESSKYNTDKEWKINDDEPELSRANDNGPREILRYNIDFVSPISSTGTLESGYQLRYDTDKEDYIYEDYDNASSKWIADIDKQNKTDYTKNIQALYATYANTIFNFDYKLGLRTEYMDRTLKQLADNKKFNINRLDWFPSAYLSRKIGKTFQIQLNYSRRVQRPRGRQLDPKVHYNNPKTLRMGNPYLLPEYVNSYELNFQKQIKQSFVFMETYYRETNNVINFALQSAGGDTIILTYENLNSNKTLGLELGANLNPFKWWRISTSLNGYYFKLSGTANGEVVDKESFSWRWRFNSNFSIKKKTKIQLNAFYMAPSTTAQGKREAMFSSSIAAKQSFFDNRLSVTLKLSDIFNSARYKFNIDTEQLTSKAEFRGAGQMLMLTLSYKINNYKQKRERGQDYEGDEGGGMDMM